MKSSNPRRLTSHSRNANATCLRLERLEERTVLASWVEGFGGSGIDTPDLSQTVDPHGNAYISGFFASPTADFDPGPKIANLSNAGIEDAFAAKYAPDGSFVWARRFGSAGVDRVYASAFAKEGTGEYLYVTGTFEGSVDFGAGGGTLTSAGGKDVFVAKLDAAFGATVWAKRIGAKGDELVSDLAVAGDRVYLTGSFSSTVDFDPGSGTSSLTPAGKGRILRSDAFVLTLDSNGSFVSAWKIGGTDSDRGWSLVADGTTLYLIGYVGGTVDLDPGADVQNATGAFIAKYSASPSPSWVQSFGAGLSTGGISIDANALYLTGSFSGTVDFDPGLGTANLSTGSGYLDVVVAKYSKTDGSFGWAKQFGGLENEYAGTSIVDEATGMLYIGGNYFSDTVDFNPSGPGVISEGSADGFLLKLDTAFGDYQQVWRMGGTGYDKARVIGMVGTTVYVAGNFETTANFPIYDDLQNQVTLTSAGETDIYLMALDQAPAALMAAGGTGSTAHSAITAGPGLQAIFAEAVRRWEASGLSPAEQQVLGGVAIKVADLSGATLGLASGHTIWLDHNAAGWGWFVDATPGDDSEFVLRGNQGEQNRIDLLTVVMHELGHLLGHDHDEAGVMAESLVAGVRRSGLEQAVVALADQAFGQSSDHRAEAWLGIWLNEQFDSAHGRAKRRW